jgi:hypothetical protein
MSSIHVLHELECAEEVRRVIRARSRVRARGIESMQGEGAGMKMSLQCVSRSVGSVIPFVRVCIQSGHMFYAVTVALLQITSRAVVAGRMLCRPL